MPKSQIINGRSETLPGFYSEIKSGVVDPSAQITYGNAVLIDTGQGAGYVLGSGVDGYWQNGINSAYTFSSLEDYQKHVTGGVLWQAGFNLFKPAGNSQITGVSSLTVIKAATTAPATVSYTIGGQTIQFTSVAEGTVCNGVLAGTILSQGYGVRMSASLNAGFYNLYFYKGSYKGVDSVNSNQPFDDTAATSTKPDLIAKSDDFKTITDLIAWATTSLDFKNKFVLTATPSTTVISGTDLTNNAGLKLFAGATETYSSSLVDNIVNFLDDVDFTHIIAPDNGANALSATNLKLVNFVQNLSKFERFVWIGGGETNVNFSDNVNSSVEYAKALDSTFVYLVHGSVKQNSPNTGGFKIRNSFLHAAMLMGRACGVEPQIPLTYKKININGTVHSLTKREKELCLKYGVITSCFDSELGFTILHDNNTIQENNQLIPANGRSYSGSICRIKAQLNKELIINGKIRFFGSESGANRNTTNDVDVIEWLKGFLKDKTANSQRDNLIMNSQNYKVSYDQDIVRFSYDFEPNTPVRMIIGTGTMKILSNN